MILSLQKFIRRLLGRPPAPTQPDEALFVRELMHMLTETDEKKVSCEDVYEVLDLYTEAVMRGEDVSEVMPLVQAHLEMCGDCREQAEMLIEIVTYTSELT